MTTNTSTVKIRKIAFEEITSIDIDKTLACKVTIKLTEDAALKDCRVIIKHSTEDCKRLAFKQARSFLRKSNVTASLKERKDLSLTHKVVTLKINDIKVKVNAFVYTVNVAQSAVDSDKEQIIAKVAKNAKERKEATVAANKKDNETTKALIADAKSKVTALETDTDSDAKNKATVI